MKIYLNEKPKVSSYFGTKSQRSGNPYVFGGITFVVLYTLLNFGAVSVMGEYYISSLFGADVTLANEIKEETKNLPTKLPVAGVSNVLGFSEIASSLKIHPSTDRVVLERLGVNAPIQSLDDASKFSDFDELEEAIQKELEEGVVHYPGTALPSDNEGNVFLTGHSSYYPWAPGRYKDVFAILHAAKVGDEVKIYYNEKSYMYIIREKVVVTPDNVEVLRQTQDRTLTLMTCTPIGTNAKRLIIKADLVEEFEESTLLTSKM